MGLCSSALYRGCRGALHHEVFRVGAPAGKAQYEPPSEVARCWRGAAGEVPQEPWEGTVGSHGS